MTDKVEKAINDLERARKLSWNGEHCNIMDDDDALDVSYAITDAIALLKAWGPCEDAVSRAWLLAEYDRQHQGPPGGARRIIETAPAVAPKVQGARLLTLEEALSIGQTSCWMQIRSGEVWLAQVHPTINGNVSISRLRQKDCIEEKQAYGKRWVCWTDKPTKEQRKTVKWE